MSYSDHREIEDALSDNKTWTYEVGSYRSNPSPRIVVPTFPRGSFATTQWVEKRHAIQTKAVKELIAETPASA